MGEIVVHAGMPKTGSSSIQQWLTVHASRLRSERNADVVVWRSNPDDALDPTINVDPFTEGKINSSEFVHRYRSRGVDKQAAASSLMEGLARSADHHELSVSTGEVLCRPFFEGDRIFLGALEELAKRHHVRVAYYVRPQHSALEAAWRQWGYRSGLPPSQYLARRCGHLNYLQTLQTVRSLAPSVSFEMRLFQRGALTGGDVVLDFLECFLGIAEEDVSTLPSVLNAGLPLDVVNALAAAPRGLLWRSQHDNKFQNRLKKLLEGKEIEDSQGVVSSRLALRQYCHDRFEADNEEMMRAIGVGEGAFVPDVDSGDRTVDLGLDMFDAWWRPHASPAELELLYHALAIATGVDKRPSPGPRPD